MLQKNCILPLILFFLLFIMPPDISALPERAEEIAKGKEEFGDLTEKEHCIMNLMLSYTKKDIEKFSELLHIDYSYWMGKKKIWSTQEEIEKTAVLFNEAKLLYINIDTGSWTQVNDFRGTPCKKCWESTRAYTIKSQLSENGTIYEGSGFTRYIITQVEGKYKILAIIDLGKELSQ